MTQWDLPKSYKFKHDDDSMLLTMINPILLCLLAEMNMWALVEDLEFKYTRTVDHKIKNVSTSDIHSTGRAVDISSKNWPNEKIKEFCDYFNSKYAKKYGTSKSGNNPRVAYFEDGVSAGTFQHFHIQVRRGLSIAEFKKEYYNNNRRKL